MAFIDILSPTLPEDSGILSVNLVNTLVEDEIFSLPETSQSQYAQVSSPSAVPFGLINKVP